MSSAGQFLIYVPSDQRRPPLGRHHKYHAMGKHWHLSKRGSSRPKPWLNLEKDPWSDEEPEDAIFAKDWIYGDPRVGEPNVLMRTSAPESRL